MPGLLMTSQAGYWGHHYPLILTQLGQDLLPVGLREEAVSLFCDCSCAKQLGTLIWGHSIGVQVLRPTLQRCPDPLPLSACRPQAHKLSLHCSRRARAKRCPHAKCSQWGLEHFLDVAPGEKRGSAAEAWLGLEGNPRT